ncbi:hypothetical protein F3Y22_tig00111053pilonHSYRG00022 [Hibiscus syriacus]|uniref:Tafazzin family protein n=1 Tax=Hibiscus syriacus TaxID=106335 RepID=A0A6A2Z667_HIBSY|nr:hypothetical protein F3Y22_tig00111053pilonHSYRG00022 [Hibiscus syriacus]
MDMGTISKLNTGGWIHIFPEGSRSRDGGKTVRSSKRGVGRLVLDADSIPIVLPFVHTGMQDVMPIGANFPRIGKTVTVLIGYPILFDDLLNSLKVKVDKLALEQSIQSENLNKDGAERKASILHQVDWDPFGLGSHGYMADESSVEKTRVETKLNDISPEEATPDRHLRMGFSRGGIGSRFRGYMDPTELMGFAARGLLMNRRSKENCSDVGDIRPLKTWKRFFESNLLLQWNT